MLHLALPEYQALLKADPNLILKQFPNPAESDGFFAWGLAQRALGQIRQAESSFRKALQFNLQHIPSLYALSLQSFRRGAEREARNFFKRAIRLDPNAATNVLSFQRELRLGVPGTFAENNLHIAMWCLHELEAIQKMNAETVFQMGKLHFEQSKLKEALPYLREALGVDEYHQEASEYISYIFEHLYQGDELIEKSLELAGSLKNPADLFFNLAMVCQHEQQRTELALHFFYLASRADPTDPGLRFSLEQSALDLIARMKKSKRQDPFLMMLAHLYQGSIAMAKRYAESLEELQYPESFQWRSPDRLWKDWLLTDGGILGASLRDWFGPRKSRLLSFRRS